MQISFSSFTRAAASALGLLVAAAASAQPVLITASQTISPGQTTITPTAGGAAVPLATAQITVSGSGTILTINGAHSVESLTLQSSARATHTPGFTFTADLGEGPITVGGFWLTITGDLTINSGSSINVDELGFGSAQGPGAGGSNGGGGHGGNGGGASGGSTYGSFTQPTTLGSGGGIGTTAGGAGGGAIRLIVGGTLSMNGVITANGDSLSGAGAGAGGSIWITAPTIIGTGTIRANGGTRINGASHGGGGRVAVYADRTGFSGALQALSGGSGAGTGRLYLDGLPTTRPQLILHGGQTILTAPLTPQQANIDVVLSGNAVLSHAPGDQNGLLIDIAGDLTINSGSSINVDELGFGSAQGPGAGGSNGGGGHGGNGGGASGGGTYGSFTQPTTFGSGGGIGTTAGGAGGGAIRLIVGGTLSMNGVITANGDSLSGAGAGAGGSIWITAPTIIGTGTIRANGGTRINSSGHGGGGRVAVYSCVNALTGTVQVLRGGSTAQDGSVLIDTIAGNVAAVASAFCTGDLATLSVEAGGVGTITYQWRRNGVDITDGLQPSGAIYAGATTAELTITGVTQTEQGSYDVEVIASCASIISNAVPVDVVGASPFPCDNLDFNNDCSAFDPLDIEAFLSVYSEGPCIPAEATCNDIDFNNDGSLFDPLDIDSYLSVFSEGPCL